MLNFFDIILTAIISFTAGMIFVVWVFRKAIFKSKLLSRDQVDELLRRLEDD